ncbi:MAG TPA: hypothetical protein VLX92_14535, partial [Kofleriaceae bacterium]|nr:hypothetical protein [Kofleriaceae bacterium]
CTGCHAALADAATARAHAGDGHAAVTCLDCHMAKVVMGIDRFVRTHRIASPSDPRLLGAAAPNACNLCHLDRTIDWTIDALAERWDVHLPASGDERGAGEAWLASREPGLRVLAAAAYARSPLGRAALPELVRGLDDPLAYVRAWTAFAVEDVLGRRLGLAEYDPRAPAALRARQLAALRARVIR